MAKKKRSTYGWVYSPTATAGEKAAITRQFAPVLEELRGRLTPIPEPQILNHCIDVFSKWRGNYFYIMLKFKTGESATIDEFDTGLARVEYYGENRFNLSYFRYTGRWEPLPMYHDISFDKAKEAILNGDFFVL